MKFPFNYVFCRFPVISAQGFVIRTYKKVTAAAANGPNEAHHGLSGPTWALLRRPP